MKKLFLVVILIISSLVLASCEDFFRLLESDFESDNYTATFKGDYVQEFSQDVEKGEKLLKPQEPTKEGYTFIGWFIEASGNKQLWDFEIDTVNQNLILIAEWEENIPFEENDITTQLTEDLDALDSLFFENNKYLLPDNGPIHQTRIVWQTKDPNLITKDGFVVYPTKTEGEKIATLTATAKLNNTSLSKDFKLTIKPRKTPIVTSSKELDFINLTDEFAVEDNTLTTYFVDNSELPYVDVESFLLLLDGLIYATELDFSIAGDILNIDYQVENIEDNTTLELNAQLDFFADTLFVNSLDFFSHYLYQTATDYAEGLTYLEPYIEKGSEVLFDLANYRVDLITHTEAEKTLYLIPFNIANLIFTNDSYYSLYYNGDSYYGIYGFPSFNDEVYQIIKTSSFNNKDLPFDVGLATFDQLAFSFDHFFGLRNEETYQIETTFYELLTPYITDFFNQNSLNEGLSTFIRKTIDELHTSTFFPGYYNDYETRFPAITHLNQYGQRVQDFYNHGLFPAQNALQTWPNSQPPNYRFIDDNNTTAIIYLADFLTATVGTEKTIFNDSDYYMKQTLNEVFDVNPNVENLIIDLSYNLGGNLGALFRVLGYLTDQSIELSYQNPLDNSKITHFVDVDTDAYDVNWFLITSPATFSAGNLMTAIVSHQNLGTILGEVSGGGACSITPIILADGSFFAMSSNTVLSLRTEVTSNTYIYQNIEYGIDPDLPLSVFNTQDDLIIFDIIKNNS